MFDYHVLIFSPDYQLYLSITYKLYYDNNIMLFSSQLLYIQCPPSPIFNLHVLFCEEVLV